MLRKMGAAPAAPQGAIGYDPVVRWLLVLAVCGCNDFPRHNGDSLSRYRMREKMDATRPELEWE
jgi:hypothetical protein